MILNYPTTFVVDKLDGDYEVGTVEATLWNETKRVPCRRNTKHGFAVARGFTGRYRTGGKVWPATVMVNHNGSECVNFGRDDRDSKFRKEHCIWFEK